MMGKWKLQKNYCDMTQKLLKFDKNDVFDQIIPQVDKNLWVHLQRKSNPTQVSLH